MRTLASSLLLIAVLPVGKHAMAADRAAALIESVSRAAADAGTWEAEGRVATQDSAVGPVMQTEANFRIVIERAPAQRAHQAIGPGPLQVDRVCDGSWQWGYLADAKKYWKIQYARMDACADPFDEWPHLAADLHDPVIAGADQLRIGDRVIDCIVVNGNYAGTDASRTGKRTLWIEDATKTIWRYRAERSATFYANSTQPAVRIYTLRSQTSDGVWKVSDSAFQPSSDWARLPGAPALYRGDAADTAPHPASGHPTPSGAFSVGNGVTAPVLIHKTAPEYTEEARASHYQGTVVLSVKVEPDGVAHNIKVIRSIGLGLDEKAIEAVSQWKFKPGTKDGVPVTVAAQIEVNFRLLDDPKK
jgi:TonB family protein